MLAPADRIDAHLGGDPRLAPLVARRPGLRVPGATDGWELAVRAVLGQQVSVRAATTISGRLVRALGRRHPGATVDDPAAWRFPTARRLAQATVDEVKTIGLPRTRAATLVALARAVGAGQIDLSPTADVAATVTALQRVPGIGPWTASYISIRAFRAPDLFLPGDLAARKALGVTSAREAERASARWSPYRSYALMHLWGSLSAPGGVSGG